MSTTGGRNRKRSDVKRTATRRNSPTQQAGQEPPQDDEVTAAADERKDAAGSSAVGTRSATTEKADVVETQDRLDEDARADDEGAETLVSDGDDGSKKGRRLRKAKDGKEKPEKELSERAKRREAKKAMRMGNPAWFIPVMLGLFILGLVWIVVFYLSQMAYPIPDIQYWNLVIGFGLLMLGFAMTTRWK